MTLPRPYDLTDLNLCKAFWRAEPSCIDLACVPECDPLTTHCGRQAELFARHNEVRGKCARDEQIMEKRTV